MSVPATVMVCGAVQPSAMVATLVGENFRAAWFPMVILPLMVWPGVPVILKFNVPFVTVRLLIDTALIPEGEMALSAAIFNSKSAYVRPLKEGDVVFWCLYRLPVSNLHIPAFVPKGLAPAFAIYVDPEANTTELVVPEFPKAFPVKLVPAVKIAPLLNVIPPSSLAVNLWPEPVKLIPP